MDTRGTESPVGPRGTPLDGGSPYTVQVTGTNGNCVLPAGIAGVALNTTIVAPSAGGWLSLYPAGTTFPGTSNLNWVAGQAPTPNKVDVKLSADGRLTMLNNAGTVHVIADVVGYYTSTGLADLTAQLTALQNRVSALEAKTASMSTPTVDGQPTVRFSGVNVQIVSGAGNTAAAVNGKGNLIVGYNENEGDTRTGSHNLVIGQSHSYASYGGFIAGLGNTITATGPNASVTGGGGNTASGVMSSVTGGISNTASGVVSSVTGGYENTASGQYSSVTVGGNNTASGQYSSVTGGFSNTASTDAASVTGGFSNTASGFWSSVTGGYDNTASTDAASVTGGFNNTASGYYSSVTGGLRNTASGSSSSVTGGQYLTAPGTSGRA
jgi:hypothetical protein